MSSQTENQPRHRILAADDDPIMRELMMAQLGTDVEVVVAENGQIAWEILVDQTFDLAIIDLGMPELDGFGLIQHLRQTPKTIDLPIIVATSRGDEEAIERAFNSGASGFVTKPINWSLFKHTVQFVLKSGQTERQLRRAHAASDRQNSTKDNLLAFMAAQLEQLSAKPERRHNSRLLTDAMEFSRLLPKTLELTKSHVQINDLILAANQHCEGTSCSSIAAAKSVKIIARKSLVDLSVNVDIDLMNEALCRLLNRAIKSSPDGGTVEILIGVQRDKSLVISVRDNGQIIPASQIKSQLTALSDTPQEFIEKIQSNGLDLQIVNRIAEHHGGRTLFQNKIGEGNVSAIWLPAKHVFIQQLEKSA